MFLQGGLCLWFHVPSKGVCLWSHVHSKGGLCPWSHVPSGGLIDIPAQRPPSWTETLSPWFGKEWAVRFLLECILVPHKFAFTTSAHSFTSCMTVIFLSTLSHLYICVFLMSTFLYGYSKVILNGNYVEFISQGQIRK